MSTTRDQFLDVAQHLFAERGFYGVSIAAVAQELGLSKQALLHHFGSKEKLYAEVLQSISEPLNAFTREIMVASDSPAQQVEELVVAQYRSQISDSDSARLIMRELLDNEPRADKAVSWYLKDYLSALVDAVLQLRGSDKSEQGEALAVVYQLLGAVHYFAVSQPTLSRMFGEATLTATRATFETELRTLVRARLSELSPT